MSFFSWLRNRTSTRPPRAQHRPTPPRFRPHLEVLEDRCVPSTLTVTNNLDNGAVGSLRYEVAAAQSGDTIVFAPSLKGQTIALSGSELYIDKNLTIQGLGAKNLAISGGVSGDQSRVFEVAPNVQVALSAMTIENGENVAAAGATAGDGAGILNFGTLTLSGDTLSGNIAVNGDGGGIANEYGGTLTVSNCTISGNSSNDIGGGIFNALGATLTITGCTLSHNFGGSGGGIYSDGTTTLSDSSVTQNEGDGILNDYNGVLTILSSTVNHNHSGCDLDNLGTWSADSSSTIGTVCLTSPS